MLRLLECTSKINAVSCTASTEFNTDFRCNNAIDGYPETNWATKAQGIGAWIKIDLENQGSLIIYLIVSSGISFLLVIISSLKAKKRTRTFRVFAVLVFICYFSIFS